MSTPIPPLHEYVLAHPCPTCGAEPGMACDAPRKTASFDRIDRDRGHFGGAPIERDPLALVHKRRYEAGRRHRSHDIGTAPWPEDRLPGQRYDTLPLPAAPKP